MMNKKVVCLICGGVTLFFALVISLSIAGKNKFNSEKQTFYITPDVEEICYICSLATTELDYNNVAKVSKSYWFMKKREKKLWIEHRGTVKVGIDVNKLEISSENNVWTLRIPKAEILSVSCNPDFFTENSFTISDSNWKKISAYDQNAAMAKAISDMKVDAENNTAILHDAQIKAKKILENYFNQLNIKTNSNIQIKWELL